MSGNRPISQKTRDKVEKAMRELGYVPDVHARAMISNHSHVIGLLTETTKTTQGVELFPILRAIRATAKEHGYDLILMSSTGTTEDLADMRRLGKGNLVDAFIMLGIRHHDGRLKSAMKLGLPIVAVRRPRRAVPLPLRGLRHEGDRGHGVLGDAHHRREESGDRRGPARRPQVSVHQHLRPGERHMRRTAWDTAGAVRGEGHALAIVRAADREVSRSGRATAYAFTPARRGRWRG